jgi:hypothetical protein
MTKPSEPKIEIELRERKIYAEIGWRLEYIVEDLLKLGERSFNTVKEYVVTVKRNGEEYKEPITVSFNVEVKASDTLLEKAKVEE